MGEVASRSDDGEGKDADKNAPRQFRLKLLKVYPHRKLNLNRGKVSPEAGLPSQALRASSPKVGALGKGGKSPCNA